MTRRLTVLLAAAALAAAACAGAGTGSGDRVRPQAGQGELEIQTSPPEPSQQSPNRPRRVDPRQGGFEIGFGEFAVALEADAIRPGPVRFVIRNGGELVHGFEMEIEGEDGDSSGPGSGGDDGFKIEKPTFGPGQTIGFRLNLSPGIYKVECFVANHDDLGMEALLEVRAGAPLVRAEAPAAGGDAVMIEGFAFEPATIEVSPGTKVTWMNHDPEDHTVTAEDGAFDSGPLGPGKQFRATLDEPGSYAYFCAIHPTMKGTVEVA